MKPEERAASIRHLATAAGELAAQGEAFLASDPQNALLARKAAAEALARVRILLEEELADVGKNTPTAHKEQTPQ